MVEAEGKIFNRQNENALNQDKTRFGSLFIQAKSKIRSFKSIHGLATTLLVMIPTVILWQIVSMLHLVSSIALPSPLKVIQEFDRLNTLGYGGHFLIGDIITSLIQISIGFVVAVVVGAVIGISMARINIVFRIIDPFLQFIRPVPPLAYIPLLVVWFGIGELPKVLLIFIGTIPVIIIGTMSGVKTTPKIRISVAKTLGATETQIFRYVILPSALPAIITAMRVGIGVAWTCLVAAEMIAANEGLGWLVQFAGQDLQVSIVIVGIIVIGSLGYSMELCIRLLETYLVPWRGHA
jgi:NitT/TauT family transport system permease protein/taurine transport system permease protein